MTRWLIFIFSAMTGLSLWILFSNQNAAPSSKSNGEAILDGYMTQAYYTQYDEAGQVHAVLYTPQMTHYTQDNTSYFDHPQLTTFSKKRIPWTVTATQGKAVHDGDEVDLWGGVRIHQAPQPNYPETEILTEAMTVYPHRSYAETHQPVTITRPDTHIQAIGLEAYFKTGVFKLLSEVKGSYEPPKNNPL